MAITTLKKLATKLSEWIAKAIPDARVDSNDSSGRDWFLKKIEYEDKLTLEDLKEVTDRDDLNDEFRSRYKDLDPQSRKGISALKVEISALYSFNKSFVQRYKGRMHFYRDDLSQKGARNMVCVGQAMGMHNEFKQQLDT
jgi:hypothetical protein